MHLRSWSAALLAVLVISAGCGQQPGDEAGAEEPFAALREAYGEAETPQDKLAVCELFLAEHPTDENASSVLETAVYHLSEDLGDLARARALAESTVASVEDPDSRFEMRMTLWQIGHDLGEPIDLAEIAGELATHSELGYREYDRLMEAAVESDQWALAEQYSTAAVDRATPEAYRADYPDREMEDDEVLTRVERRRATALAHLSWAQLNLGRHEHASATFAAAEEITPLNYVGVPETPLHRFWGRAALDQDDLERAEELLAADAVMAGDETSLELLREVFARQRGSEHGFDEYLWTTRQRFAREVDDFTLPTYDGSPVSLASSSGKVVVLAFWFPT